MELAQKFRVVAVIKSIERPTHVELDKPYPILGVFKQMWAHFIITLMLRMNNDKGLGFCVLSPTYSKVFTDNDISEISAEPGKLKLIHRKKDCCDMSFFGYCNIVYMIVVNKGTFFRLHEFYYNQICPKGNYYFTNGTQENF
jgi:hypothetical protein